MIGPSRCVASLTLGLALSALTSGCGGPPPPAVTVSESNYREAGDTPKKVVESPHDLSAPPAESTATANQDEAWWTLDPPCPEGSTLYGGPPPDHSEVGCKTDKGVNFGRYTRFHENGKKAEEGAYEKHVAIGTWVQWNDSGVKVKETNYEKGAQHGIETEWFPDGKIKTQKTYAHGKRDGLTTIWDADGNKRSAIEYRDGKQHGAATYWDASGNVARVEQWDLGKRLK